MEFLIWIIALVGHLGFWCLLFNAIHATALPRSFRKRTEKLIILAVAWPFIFCFLYLISQSAGDFEALSKTGLVRWLVYPHAVLGCFFIGQWAYYKLHRKRPSSLIEENSQVLNVRREFKGQLLRPGMVKLIGSLPFNDCLKLARENKTLLLDIPEQLDGLKICQISDLHYTGQIGIEYFHRVVEEANRFEPDLVFITGDIVDEPECLDWLESTLGKLVSKHGVFYVLGNHDLRLNDEIGFRDQLSRLGIQQAAGAWHQVTIEGVTIGVTGNELPWFRAADQLEGFPDPAAELRILLSHSPDQLDWARRFGKNAVNHPRTQLGGEHKTIPFDLMFAGHNHGGQIVFPIVGPVVAPSKYGVRYAAGTFQIENMLMHVSRGIGGDEPIRLLCPPELGLFTLKSSRAN